MSPQAVCGEQLTTEVTLKGEGLSPVPIKVMEDAPQLALPAISLLQTEGLDGQAAQGEAVVIGDDPAAADQSHVRWSSQQEMRFDVYPELGLSPGLYSIQARNPSGQAASWDSALLVVPAPTLEPLTEDIVCAAKASTLILRGTGFIRSGELLPSVSATPAGGEAIALTASAADNCTPLPGSAGLESCTQLTVELTAGLLPPGELFQVYSLSVTNPDPVGCVSSEPVPLTVVIAPELETIDPELICTAQGDNTLTVTGRAFLQVGELGPQLLLGEQSFATELGDCTPLSDSVMSASLCNTLSATVTQGALEAGVHQVTLLNPAPADCVSSNPLALGVAPPPAIESITPQVLCDLAAETVIRIEGSGFLSVAEAGGPTALPSVTIGQQSFTPTLSGCSPVEGLSLAVETCIALEVTVPQGTFAIGEYTVTVQNPAPADCQSSDTINLTVAAPPSVSGVVPTKICEGGGALAISGGGFSDGIMVTLGGYPAASVTVQSANELSATFGALPLEGGGPFDLAVGYGEGCMATLPAAVSVTPGPQLFFADPPVAYNGIDTQITLYGSGFSGALNSISLQPSSGGAAIALDFSYDVARPNQVQAVVPAGTAPGIYDLILDDQTSCDAVLASGLTVTEEVTLAITRVEPPFGGTASTTGVTVFADTLAGGGFAPVPRLYLTPQGGGDAASVGSVTFIDSGRVTALVPAGLAAGVYDLIAVNPGGAVGLLLDAFTVTSQPPPVLETITPGAIANLAGQQVLVGGQNFRQPEALLRCLDLSSNTELQNTPQVASFTASEVTMVVDASSFPNGAVCMVRITNTDDGAYGELSALVITNPAQNLAAFQDGPQLEVARRALVSVSNQATSAARFIYAIGGDDGTAANPLGSVEVAPVDIFGEAGAFFTQRNQLQTARSYAGAATVGRCIYLAGGISGAAALSSVERACVLDPADRPQLADLDLATVPGEALPGGLYYYQVAALLDASHPQNPGGETLPSEPFPLLLPTLANRQLTVTVHWSAVPGAVGYRVYRSPAAGAAADALELLAEVGAAETSLLDSGAATQAAAERPLRIGATGSWHTLSATLAEPRQGPGVAVAPDPADATVVHLYVLGGKGQNALSSGERLAITLQADGAQTTGSFQEAGANLSTARWQLSLWSVGNQQASMVSSPTHLIYAGGGVATNGSTMEGDVDAFEVQAGGALGNPMIVDSMQPSRAGYGIAAVNKFLYAFGGNKATPDRSNTGIQICTADGDPPQCASGPPELENWNNLSAQLRTPRYLLGSAVQSGFIYILGGTTDVEAATRSTEYTIW